MKNFTQVNRASSGAKKNFTQLESNLSGMAWFLHVIERRFSSADKLSGSRAERSLTSEETSIQHPFSIHSASIGHPLDAGGNQVATRSLFRIWKYAAMMALLLTLGIGEMWGDTTYKLVSNPSSTPVLSGNFITGTRTLSSASSVTIDGQSFTKYLSGLTAITTTAGLDDKAGENSIDYDMKTTKTVFYVYVKDCNTSVYLHKLEEGKSDTLASLSTGGTAGVKLTFTVYATKNKRVALTVGNNSLKIYQIEAVEQGTALPKPGDVGYEIQFNKGRYAGKKASSNDGMSGSIDGMDIVSYEAVPYNGKTSLELVKNSKDSYVKFTTGSSPGKLKVTFSGGDLCYNTTQSISSGQTAITSGTEYTLSASTNYWIMGCSGDRPVITKIEFVGACTAPSSVSIGDQWLAFVGEPLTLTASLTGGSGDHTYQWYKDGTSDGYAIEGATSATYYKAEAEAGDADNYYCKVSTEGDDDVWSAAYKVQVLRLQLMWSDGTTVSDYTYHNFRSLGGNKATVSIPLEAYNYSFYIIDGFKAYGNNGTIQRSNYTSTPWTHNVSNQRTGLNCDKAGTYIFTIDYSNYSSWQVSVGFPEDYYYKGNEDGWSSTHAMDVSCDGSYAYYWAKGKNSLNALDKGNNNNFLIVNSAGTSTLADGSKLEIRNGESSGFGGTDIWGTGHMGKWDGATNASIYNVNDFYIIVFFPKTYVNTTSSPKICASTKLPDTGTTADELVYFDNSESWSNVYYRIGHKGYNDAEAMTAVPGTARLYKMTTVAWAGYEAWNIANNKGNYGSHSIYDITTNTITGATNYFKCEDDGNITILLDGVHNTESGCTYYNVTTSQGLLTHTATVGATTNGSIRLNWTDINDAAKSATSTTAGLAHTCNLQVTGVPNTGYEIATLTVNGAAFTSGNTHVLAADATIAATFSLVNYNVTYSAPSNGNYTIQVASGSASSETKTATYGQTITLAASANTGYHFDSWTVTGATSGDNITVTNNQFTMPAENVTVTATFAANTNTITLNRNGGSGANQQVTATYNSSTLSAAVTTPERDGYNFRGWYTYSDGSGLQVINTSGNLNANVGTITGAGGIWVYDNNLTLYARWTQCEDYSFSYGTFGSQDWAAVCFSQVGETHEWRKTSFTIPNKPNFYVGKGEDFWSSGLGVGDTKSASYTTNWTTTYAQVSSIGNGAMQLLPAGASARAVGLATGAIGTLVIWDNTADKNLSVGFLPSGYGVTTADGTYAFTIGDGYFCYTDPVTISSTEASGNFQVKLATSSSYVACAQGTAENASAVDGRKISGDANIANGKKGVFQMWQNSTANNFGLRFVTVHDVSFDMQSHGDAISDYTNVRYNDKIVAPTAPTASGYTFGGWYKEAGCTNAWDFANDVVTAATTLYAKWTADVTYTVTYVYNGADGGASPASATGSSVSLPNPTKEGYTLQGWYTSSGSLAGAATATYNPTSDITLYALWRADCAGSGGGGGTLFSQNFSGSGSLTYTQEVGYTKKSGLTGIVGNAANLFTSITTSNKNTTGIAINHATGGNSVNATGIFQAYFNNTSGYWSVIRTNDFAATAPTAVKMSMDFYLDQLGSSSSAVMVNFAIGDGFSESLKSSSAESASNIHSGWGITVESSMKMCAYDTYGTKIYNTALSDKTWYSVTWVINNTGSDLTYDDPDGSGTTTLANDKFDIWLKTQAQTASNYTKVVSARDANTASKALQELYIGHASGKKHEFRMDNIVVTDLTPSGGDCYYITYNGNGATGGYTKDETAYALNADPTVASNSFTKTGYTFTGWNTLANGTGDPYAAGGTISDISADVTLYAQWAADATTYELTWNTNGGSDLACSGTCTSGDLAYGATIVAPTDPTKSNYTFDGWNTANDGSGSAAAATMPASDVTYYAAWKQTVTLNTGSQGSDGNKTPYVYLNGTALSDDAVHSAAGYTLQGYYTAGSGGVKVLNADGTFAAANVTDYITSSKWSRTGAAPTLYAQWVASEDCHTLKYAWKVTGKFCDDPSTSVSDTVRFPANASNLYFTESGTGNTVAKGSSYNIGKTKDNYFLLTAKTGYQIKSICFYGKVEDSSVNYTTDGSSWSSFSSTNTSGDDYYSFNGINASHFGIKLTAESPKGVWIRNMVIEVCAAGGTTYSVTYDGNDETGGTAPTDAYSPYDYGTTVTVLGNTGSLAKTNYTFAGWATNDDGTGSSYVADNTFSITANTTLYAKWTQSVTLNKNGGSTDGSATAVWNATGLTGITHAKPAAGYKLLGYYSASSNGTKVLNSDGSFAATNVTDYITDGKWSRTSATTLYAEYESAGALIWNLSVNTDATSLTTSSKTSAFTEISTSNMSNAELKGGLSYSKSKKSELTGKIDVPSSEDAAKYVELTFKVADGYKFTPSSAKVIIQPVETSNSDAKIILTDGTRTITKTKENLAKGKKDTVTLTNSDDTKYMMGTVTLKIYVYGASSETYRLGTPIIIEGEVEEACATMPSFTRLSFGETSYKVGETPDNLEVVGGTNITTYAWKQNTTNDRSGGGNADGVNDGSSYTPSTSSAGTMYYWCEMTNSTCGITIKTSAVGITVAAAKSDATVTWTGPASTPNYGGGGYTIKATVNETEWDGNAADLVITAPAGIRIYNVSSGTDGSSKYVQADFDVQTSFDRSTYSSNIPFTVSAAATGTYNAISNDHNTAYSACAGAGEGSSYYICMRKTVTKDGNYYHCANTDGWISPNISSSYSTGKAEPAMAIYFDTVASSNTQYVWVRTYHANINKVRIYADFRANNMTVSNVYKHTAYFSADSKYAVDYTAVYNDDEENSDLGDVAQGYVDIILDEVMAANDILLVKFSAAKVRPLGAVITESSAGTLTTSLAWSNSLADKETVNKTQSSANFTYTASTTGTNSNTLGAVTYSSSNTSCATVNATTGEVTITATGTSDLSTTITATLAASGCYKGKTITYTIEVPGVSCSVTTGTLTSDVTSKCSTEDATLTLTGFESGASVQWYKGESTISDGAIYDISDDGTTLVTKEAGTYSVMVTNSAGTCSDRSNSITISNISATASVTKVVDEWYVKNGRLTPDIALWSVSEGATLKSVTWSPTNTTGLDCELRDGIIYLEGKEPNTNSSSDVEYTLTATITDECGDDHVESTKTIKITHQKNTDKHVLAFVVNGTDKGGFTEGITAAQTTDVPLYKTIAANFDVQATNCYASDDEKKVKQYYSQFDILCITDYPNSNKTGVNKKKYVDVLGTLIDIRPILTMEAFVSDKANWKAKGISGNPKDPTTRQYTMDLQCKDHEIFAGTNLVKIGEDDETMYRVTMVEKDSDQYKTLDATYGAGAHGKDDGYAYHKYPALQGFTFNAEMLSDGLLPLGLIEDGSGNELQVGVERQAEMSARLMVLGVNSYAMERLTADGQKVIINALNYLMKKREEEIADCSIAFIGGDETNPKDWNTAANWKGGVKPDKTTREIRILAEVEIKNGDSIHAMAPIKIASGGTYNEGADNAEGKITINAGGALIVDGRIQAVTAPNYSKARGTSVEDIVLNTSSSAQAALIFNNDAGDTKATVNFYSLGRKEGNFQYQYIASPMEVVPVSESYAGTGVYTYVYTEAGGWERRGYYTDLYAFEGVAITTRSNSATVYTVQGTLANTREREISITKYNGGDNMIGNSWVAPIQISELSKAPNTATLASSTVYVYCSGRDATLGTGASGSTETAGQWLAIPFNAASFADWSGLKVVPAMNAFEFMADAAGTLTLNYDTLVRGNHQNLTAKARAPKRKTEHEGIDLVRIRVADTKTHIDIHLFEGDVFSEAFDDGWEAKYIDGEGVSAQLYAMNGEDKMAVLATSTLEGTVLGFVPGREREYTFSFHGADNGYYLNDLKLKTSTPISETEHYTFTYEEGDTHRFYISKTRIDAPQTPTDVTNPEVETPKAQKFIYKDKMYIMINGRVYSAEGALVK